MNLLEGSIMVFWSTLKIKVPGLPTFEQFSSPVNFDTSMDSGRLKYLSRSPALNPIAVLLYRELLH